MKAEELYKKTCDIIAEAGMKKSEPEEIMKRRRKNTAARGPVKAAAVAAALLLCVGASNLITWAASGSPWIITVSDSLFNRERERLEERMSSPEEGIFKSAESRLRENSSEETEDIYSRLEIETYSPEEAAALEKEGSEVPVVKGDLTDEQIEVLWGEAERKYMLNVAQWCRNAVEKGYVYQFNKILTDDPKYGTVHSYEYIRAFSPEELEDAEFTEDYTWMTINGEKYWVMMSHTGDFNELDSELPVIDPEDTPPGEGIWILRIFSEENRKQFSEIMAIEGLESVKSDTMLPVLEGRVAVYSNEDKTRIRTFTREECKNAEISENYQVLKIAGEYYIINFDLEDDRISTKEIQLRPLEGYKGDAKTENVEKMKYYTMKDFHLGE